jgi:hypothetical protein
MSVYPFHAVRESIKSNGSLDAIRVGADDLAEMAGRQLLSDPDLPWMIAP